MSLEKQNVPDKKTINKMNQHLHRIGWQIEEGSSHGTSRGDVDFERKVPCFECITAFVLLKGYLIDSDILLEILAHY